MAKRKESPLEIAAKGGVAGLIGTAALTAATMGMPILMGKLGMDAPDPPSPPTSGSKGGTETEEEPPALFAEKVAEGVFDTSLDKGEKQVAGQAIHWGYGAAWGVFYGLGQSRLRLPHLLHGTVLGGLILLVASTLVPAMGVAPPPKTQEPATRAMQAATCLLYGWTTALAFHALSESARRK